jgi:hypothetical protein
MPSLGTYSAFVVRSLGLSTFASNPLLCSTDCMADSEAHVYRIGSPVASIVGIAEGLLEHEDLDDDVATRARAIRDLALEVVRQAGSGEPARTRPEPDR